MASVGWSIEGEADGSDRHVFVTRLDTGETFEEDIDILVMARGNLNDPKWPAIPGFDTFKGEKIHSAAWKEE